MTDLSIIIVNYKSKGLLKQCVRGVKLLPLKLNYEIIVVDNNSQDSSVKMMKEFFPEVKLIASPENKGFAAGINLGLREARGKYIMTLNPDIAVFEGSIEKMYDYLEKHLEVAVLGPRLTSPDGTRQVSCYRFPRYLTPIYRRTPLGNLPFAKKSLRHYLMLDTDTAKIMPVDWILGACMFVRAEAIKKVGLMDERFFLYFEDVDWCRRFWQSGFKVMYFYESEMVHYHQRLSA